jgi:methyl-accepting chemotaxis protein
VRRAFENLSLRTKLSGLAVALLAFLAATSLLGMSSLDGVRDANGASYHEDLVPVTQLGVAQATFNENRMLAYRHILEPDAATMRELEATIKANRSIIAGKLATALRDGDPGDRPSITRLQARMRPYVTGYDRILAMSRAGRKTEALAFAKEHVAPLTDAIATGFKAAYAMKVADARRAHDQVASAASSNTLRALALLAAALLVGGGAAFVVSRSIARSVRVILDRLAVLNERSSVDLRDALDAAAGGDLTRTVACDVAPIEDPARDELGRVAAATNGIRDNFAGAMDAYNRMTEGLRGMVGQVSGAAATISASSRDMAANSDEAGRAVTEIATAVNEAATGAERQVRSVESARVVTDEVVEVTRASAANAERTAQAAEHARQVASEGAAAADQATEAMTAVRAASSAAAEAIHELGAKSEHIGGIVATITGIAEQTNLLALNAAIEAARAGEQGRGFAVVAEEVRKLAEDAQQAAASIANLISEVQAETARAVAKVQDGARRSEEGAATVEQARAAFEAIGQAVENMHERVTEIAGAVSQIATSAEDMQRDMAEVAAVAEQSSAASEEVAASTEQTSASAQEIAAGAQQLAGTAEDLEALVRRFQLTQGAA